MALVLANARVRAPDGVVDQIAIEDGRIVAVGGGVDAPQVDCGGMTIVPGFVDAHGHLLAYAASLVSVDCRGAPDIETIVRRVRERASTTPRGTWIRAYGYDENDLVEQRHPTRRDLDAAAPDHPVRLAHRGGHALVLNSPALATCGITTETESPPGGFLDREVPSGEPSGLLLEMGALVDGRMPALSDDDRARAVADAEARLIAAGVTAFHDAGATSGPREWDMLARLVREARFRPRLLAMTGWDAFASGEDIPSIAPEVAGRHVKITLSEIGEGVVPAPDDLARRVAAVHAAGVDVAIHAVTEGGVRAAVAAIGAALGSRPRAGHRHRIEHASICPPAVVRDVARLGITIVSQPLFLHENGDRYLRTVRDSDRASLYPFGAWERAGVAVGFGSDCPVAPPDPVMGVAAAVRRRSATGAAVAGDAMSFTAALTASTAGAARAMGIDDTAGALRPGLAADLAILSGDPEDDAAVRVVATFIAGQLAYAEPSFAELLQAVRQ